ncbi:hypothetical protein J5N97_015904 [Dioscorea zingiberensis]|uniref:Uncharacterized protein n=1 Tax=Dioscorea zingiberensis TaxID=325984 RepID=A0A9D5HEV5_9LILI|nr:hypothetical protein J5N97_015904 [Dioscorea zingiberensis]
MVLSQVTDNNLEAYSEVFLHILSGASEYDELPVRHNEGMWYEKDSSLWMLPSMNDDCLSYLNKLGFLTLQDLLDVTDMKLQRLLQQSPASELYKVKDEAWWTTTCMELPNNSINLQETKLLIISDCYLGLDQEFSLGKLNH